MLRSIGKQSGEFVESVREKEFGNAEMKENAWIGLAAASEEMGPTGM